MSLIHKIREIPWFNIPDLDQEHQEIAILIEKMAQKVLNPEKGKIVSQCSIDDIENIIIVVERHFKNEELFMINIGYPDFDRHKEEHLTVFNKAKEMMMRQHQREGGISIGTIVLLNNLMQTHLEEEDQKFVDHFYRKERTE